MPSRQSARSLFGLFLGTFFTIASLKAEPLMIGLQGELRSYTKEALSQHFHQTQFLGIVNPAYNSAQMNYQGFELGQILKRVLSDRDPSQYKVIITCADGYRPVLEAIDFFTGRALLAVSELGEKFSPIISGGRAMDPGPFYIVWDRTDAYPQGWPFQVREIALVHRDNYKEQLGIAPKGNFVESTSRGFQLFSKHCFVCHSIGYVGPKGIAPDLLYVTKYRNTHYIENVISKGKGVMPSFAQIISASEINEIQSYLQNKAESK